MSKDRFYLYKIFMKEPKMRMTIKEIALLYNITRKVAREYIQKDLEGKMIWWESSSSTFYLTPRGFGFLYCFKNDGISS